MKKQLLLTFAFLIGISLCSEAQTANEILGQSVISFDQGGMQQTYTTGGSLTTGDFNTLIGDGAGSTLNTGSRNVMVGSMAGASATNDGENVFIGHEAGKFTTTFDNVFVGSEAGEQNNTGTDNTFIGEESGTNNDSGSNNTFVGEDSGFNNLTGESNTFIGSTSGRGNTTGNGNTFVGAETGQQTNVDALFGNTGNYELDLITSRGSGFSNSTGIANAFFGGGSGHSNVGGTANTFLGYNAGARNETGNLNTFVGYGAGWNNDTSQTTLAGGDRNTYLGAIAGSLNRSGNDNIGIGHNANFSLTSGADRNVFIGNESSVRGTDNVILGYNSRTSTSIDRNNQIVLGTNSQTLQSNAAIIGSNINNNVANTLLLGGDTNTNRYSVGIGTTSANPNASLDLGDTDKGFLLNRLTTAQRTTMAATAADGSPLDTSDEGMLVYDTTENAIYTWDGSAWEASGANTDNQDISLSSNTLSITGSTSTVDLAPYVNTDNQELSLVANTLSISGGSNTIDLSSLVSSDDQNLTGATLSGGNVLTIEIEGGSSVFVDLNPIIEDVEMENDNQQLQINDLLNRISDLEDCACNTLSQEEVTAERNSGAILYQNIPNPFNGTTSIKYYVPTTHIKAAIVFSNTSGQIIDNINLEQLGDQELYFNSESLAAGMYYYTLYVDGKKIDTKKMIIE